MIDGYDIILGVVILLAVLGLALSSAIGWGSYKDLQVEAVKRGAAEWVVSPEGETTFKWKEKPGNE